MAPMTPNQFKGNWGEQYMTQRLGAISCLVRPVPNGTDVGIDLYCESTVGGDPFLHFWLQVKTGNSHLRATPIPNSFQPEEAARNYWGRQPVPVLIAVIPDSTEEPRQALIYSPIINVRTHQQDGTWSFAPIMTARDDADYRRLVQDWLPKITFLWDLDRGKLGPVPRPGRDGYTGQVLPGTTLVAEPKIRETIHRSLWRLAEDHLREAIEFKSLRPRDEASCTLEEAMVRARPYVTTLEKFVTDAKVGNYENFVTIGVYAELEGDIPRAIEMYRRAAASIVNDGTLKKVDPGWSGMLEGVQVHLRRAEAKHGDS